MESENYENIHAVIPTDGQATASVQDGSITLSTNLASYHAWGLLAMEFNIANYTGASDVTIMIIDPNNNPVSVHQFSPGSDAESTTGSDIVVIDTLAGESGQFSGFTNAGTYTVRAQLDSDVVETTFEFSGTPEPTSIITISSDSVLIKPTFTVISSPTLYSF